MTARYVEMVRQYSGDAEREVQEGVSARSGRRELGFQVISKLSMSTEPDVVECSDIGQKPVDHTEAGAVSADMWVQSQFEDSSSSVGCVEFIDPYAFDVAGREMRA